MGNVANGKCASKSNNVVEALMNSIVELGFFWVCSGKSRTHGRTSDNVSAFCS